MNGVLFLCVANSARSQMAEGLARSLAPSGVEVFSAGSVPATVNPFAIRAMEEVGIDMVTHRSKGIPEIDPEQIGTVITLCAEEVCPEFPGHVRRLHWPHDDPAAVDGDHEIRLAAFRRVRNQLRGRIEELFSDAAGAGPLA